MLDKFLPIGTICRLKDGNKNLMIVGFCQASTENPDMLYDYNGCMYPEGIFSSDINFLFNHDQIEEILYMGLINEEEKAFKTKLKEFISNDQSKNNNTNLFGNVEMDSYKKNVEQFDKTQIDIPILAQQSDNTEESIETL